MAKAFKITSWNVEWLVDSFSVASDRFMPKSKSFTGTRPSKEEAEAKLQALRNEVLEIDADVLFLIEGIRGADVMAEFAQTYLKEYELICHEGKDDKAYGTLGE
ncbi:hypothetical protein HGO38_19395 [Rhizobium sp. CG5]|uniref:hypothetical protein n=1 Tax=Rhizobium sp. CG5 TaxID=2726076 RepID=UPI0020349E71|nr:hypothetical protein [Rhizobium sp. CG5]MCM2475643.1 hypothetical protein [Rhizobium sp. CG5]